MKRLLCILLACCMLTALLAACGKKGDDITPPATEAPAGDTPTEEVETKYYLDTLAPNSYGFEKYRIMTIDGNIPKETEAFKSVVAQALWNRDVRFEDKTGVRLEYKPVANNDNAVTDMRNAVNGGEEGKMYHAFITNAPRLMTLAMEGLTEDLNTVENLDLQQSWWSQSLSENCTVNDKLYCAAGPYSEYYFHMALAMAYNKVMATSFEIEDLYTVVNEGGWTLEKMEEICRIEGVTQELQGDGNWDDNDRYAIAGFQVGLYGLFAGAGGRFSTTDEDGGINVTVATPASIGILDKIATVFNESNMRFQGKYNNFKESADLFTKAGSLFLYTSTGYMNDYLPTSPIDYGIIPTPKLNSQQTEYITCAWAETNAYVSIPKLDNAMEKAYAGLMLEIYCFLSEEIVRPEKYNRIMKFQTAHDSNASKMMDLVFDTLYFDLNLIFNFGESRSLISEAFYKDELGSFGNKINEEKDGEITSDIQAFLNPAKT